MDLSTAAGRIAPARNALFVLVYAIAGCTASDAGPARELASTTSHSEQVCGDARAEQSLMLLDPQGNPFQLEYFAGCGWKYAPAAGRMIAMRDATGAQRAYVTVAATTTRSSEPLAGDDPLTVFVDGPTGYTFAWVPEGGWKFIGQITNPTH